MKIVAVSDLHGRLPEIPPCDVLVIAGDLCPDTYMDGRLVVGFDPDLSRIQQQQWLREVYRPWERQVPANRILMTPGNHDWITRMPEGFRTEFFVDDGTEAFGMTFWFTPWIPRVTGTWNYEAIPTHRSMSADMIPVGVDVLVSHAPAEGVADVTYTNESAGCRFLRIAVQQKQPKYHFFGHIHEGQRFGRELKALGRTRSFNCAMWGASWMPVQVEH